MVTERDLFVKPLGKVFDPKKSKLLIIGTMPPCNRTWYYQENRLFWEIMSEALDIPELSQLSTTDRRKKELLLNNGVALWDIFECGWRKDGRAGDDYIVFQKSYKPTVSKIYEEIISKGKIDIVLINGLKQALEWFIEYNQENEIKQLVASGKVLSLHQTKWIETQMEKNMDSGLKYKLKWIQAIRKALGKTPEKEHKLTQTNQTISALKNSYAKASVEKPKTVEHYSAKSTKTTPEKTKKVAFVIKKSKNK